MNGRSAAEDAVLPLLTGATVLAYPATDVFVLGLVVAMLVRTQPQARRELLITGGGLTLYLIADVAYSRWPPAAPTASTAAVVGDVEVACGALQQVRELGVTVALDDFGSGQSSLSQLARLPVDTVKIDRSFTRTAVLDGGARRLLTSIVRVCQSLNLPVIAEGIETAELAVLVAEVGCDHGQGWHFGRAEPAMHLAGLLPARRVPAARISKSVVQLTI